MKKSVIEILKERIDKDELKYKMVGAAEAVSILKTNILNYNVYRNSVDMETRRQARVALISSMEQAQSILWELQLILGIDDLEKLTEDFIEWQELQSIPH